MSFFGDLFKRAMGPEDVTMSAADFRAEGDKLKRELEQVVVEKWHEVLRLEESRLRDELADCAMSRFREMVCNEEFIDSVVERIRRKQLNP